MSKKPEHEMTWTKAIIVALVISATLLITLGFVPSIFRYEWGKRSDAIGSFIQDKTGYELKDRYTLVRIHDIVSMGYQTNVFAVAVIATYKIMEKRRRRLGLRGSEAVKGYMPGK